MNVMQQLANHKSTPNPKPPLLAGNVVWRMATFGALSGLLVGMTYGLLYPVLSSLLNSNDSSAGILAGILLGWLLGAAVGCLWGLGVGIIEGLALVLVTLFVKRRHLQHPKYPTLFALTALILAVGTHLLLFLVTAPPYPSNFHWLLNGGLPILLMSTTFATIGYVVGKWYGKAQSRQSA